MAEPLVTPFLRKWEADFGAYLSEQEKEKLRKLAEGVAIHINTREINYKCMSNWYITPIKVHKYQPKKSPLCWRGCGKRGTIIHIWCKNTEMLARSDTTDSGNYEIE